jgi:hypothetical protein
MKLIPEIPLKTKAIPTKKAQIDAFKTRDP